MSHGITYLEGDATDPQVEGNKVIVHICNDAGKWGAGFVLALSKRWFKPEAAYRQWHREQTGFALGAVQLVAVTEDITVANIIGQQGVKSDGAAGPPIRYAAVEVGLSVIADWAVEAKASVHMPRIGCGLAGGEWSRIEPMIMRTLGRCIVPVFVYDFAPSEVHTVRPTH